jgi:hypothetical protein
MFETLTRFFTTAQPNERSVTSQKFERFQRICSKKARLMPYRSPVVVADHKPASDPWKTHHVFEPEHSYVPCVIYPPESLLEEGTAEKFLTCKMNPIDEFKLQRETRRRETTLSGTIARFKTKKKKSA